MIGVSDSSPLILLARIGHLDKLEKWFDQFYISAEVYQEVAIAGKGLPGAAIAKAAWIQQRRVQDALALDALILQGGLGLGEASTIQLARELEADLVLMDERRGRKVAAAMGVAVSGCVGVLEALYQRGEMTDLRTAYRALLRHAHLDVRMLEDSLARCGFPPL